MESGQLQWSFAEDELYLRHTYARITEMRANALKQHPFAAHLPIESVFSSLKHGFDDQRFLNWKLPDVTRLLTQLPHSRNFGFQERQGLESLARDFASLHLLFIVFPEQRWAADIRNSHLLCNFLTSRMIKSETLQAQKNSQSFRPNMLIILLSIHAGKSESF
jgi:hypothetical protein